MSVEQDVSRLRVDAHQHFWDPTTADYPWMSDARDVVRSIAELRGAPGGARLVGLRHHANEEPDPRWLCRPDVIRGLRLAAQAGPCFDLLVWPRELPGALDLAATVPEVRLVLDHMGKPAVRDGLDGAWAQAIRGLGAQGNVSVKLSG